MNIAQNSRLEEYAPLSGISFLTATGTRVDYCGPPALKEVFESKLSRFRYDSLIAGEALVPLLRVAAATAGTSQIVGGYRRFGLGLIFFIPPFTGNIIENKAFFERISNLPKLLKNAPSDLPEWVDAYQSASERKVSEKILKLEREVAELQEEITEERMSLEHHRGLKQLLGGTGTAFANAVAAGLRELGFDVIDGPHPRADLLSVLLTRFIAVEAKGVEGAVREAQFRQVERWTAEVNSTVGLPADEVSKDPDLSRYATQLAKLNTPIEEISEDCKGLLIIGTFRKTPLLDRTEPDFPEPVLRLINRSNVCALTGPQLFTLVMQARENPALKAEIATELLTTNGVLARGKDWSNHLVQAIETRSTALD